MLPDARDSQLSKFEPTNQREAVMVIGIASGADYLGCRLGSATVWLCDPGPHVTKLWNRSTRGPLQS